MNSHKNKNKLFKKGKTEKTYLCKGKRHEKNVSGRENWVAWKERQLLCLRSCKEGSGYLRALKMRPACNSRPVHAKQSGTSCSTSTEVEAGGAGVSLCYMLRLRPVWATKTQSHETKTFLSFTISFQTLTDFTNVNVFVLCDVF